MDDVIKEKLDLIDEYFPPQRIAASKRRWSDIWNGKFPADRLPFVAFPLHLDYYNDYNMPEHNDIRLGLLLDECIYHGKLDDDFIPSLFPGCRQTTIPSMFGAEEILCGDNLGCKKIINCSDDIFNLPKPTVNSQTIAFQWLQRQQYWLEKTNGRLPIHITDMQGPIDAAAQMWSYDNLFLCAYSEPDKFKLLMDQFSAAFGMLWQSQQNLLGELLIPTHLFGWTWIPPHKGVSLSADSMVMVSGDFFEQFFRPVLVNISEKFGGLIIHSCGNFGHLVKNIQSLPNLHGINASQMSIEQLQDSGLKKGTVAIIITDFEHCSIQIELIKQTQQLSQISIHICPTYLESQKSTFAWSKNDWDSVYQQQNKILEWLQI